MKCARCNRWLKTSVEIEGKLYGKVCARKMGVEGNVIALCLGFDPHAPKEGPPSDYLGWRERGIAHAGTRDHLLNPRFDLANKSPTGFDWGYGGSGPAQLALAILAYHTGDEEFTLQYYQSFKGRVVSTLPRESWRLTHEFVEGFVRDTVANQAIWREVEPA